ncbi:MAG: tyrosine-type recombinase/integrase [Acidimicrobiales bacterium]
MSRRAPGVWRLRVMVNGKQVQRTFRGTEAAARKALKTLKTLVAQPAAPATNVRTFGDLLEEWMDFQKSRGKAPKTLDENRREIDRRIRPRLGTVAIGDLTADDLDSAYSAWLAEGLSASSVHRHAAVISSALSQGVKWGWIKANDNPALSASPPGNRGPPEGP